MPAKKTTTTKKKTAPKAAPAAKAVTKAATTEKVIKPKKVVTPKVVVKKAVEPKIVEQKAAESKIAEPKTTAAQLPLHDLGSLKKTATAKATTPTLAKGQMYYATGKRKTSIARTRLISNGNGIVTVNNRSLEDYIPLAAKRESVKAPLRITGNSNKFDVSIKVNGGGVSSQADAMRHGVAKALLEFDPALRLSLKRAGFLTRDPRMKERKKYGLRRARRAPQWSKR